jgi:hypothetical protein
MINGTPENKFEADPIMPRTDWPAWFLQFVFGMFAGCGAGFVVAYWLFRFYLAGFDQMLLVIAGASLCCGAFTSFYGRWAWTLPSVFAPEEPPQTRNPRICSVIIGSIGAMLILVPLILHVAHYGLPSHKQSSAVTSAFVLKNGMLEPFPAPPRSAPPGLAVFLLVFAALFGYLLVRALRTGTCHWPFEGIYRDDTPLYFWFYVFLNGIAVICILSAIL